MTLRTRKHVLLGQMEQFVLFAIKHKSNHAYDVDIGNEIELKTGIKLTVGALYSTLDRMEQKGLISCVDTMNKRRYFSITNTGQDILNESINIFNKMKGDL